MLQVMTSSVCNGLRRSFYTMFGCFLAVFILIGASIIGVGAVMIIFPAAYDVLRYAGAAYLVYLGVCAVRAPVISYQSDNSPNNNKISSKSLFTRGFMVGISNPKAMLFATAYFPQFVNQDSSQAIQLLILLATFGIIEFSWYLIYALGGSQLTAAMKRESVQLMFNRLTGSLFVLFGIAMAAKSR